MNVNVAEKILLTKTQSTALSAETLEKKKFKQLKTTSSLASISPSCLKIN